MERRQQLEDIARRFLLEIRDAGAKPLFTGDQCIALARRRGWDGRPPGTLEEAGNETGVSRERVRQLEQRLDTWILEIAAHQRNQLPGPMALAVEIARHSRSDEELEAQLNSEGLASGEWSFETLSSLLRAFGRDDLDATLRSLAAIRAIRDGISSIVWKTSAGTGFAHMEAICRHFGELGGELAAHSRELTDSDLARVLVKSSDVIPLPLGYYFAASARDPTVVETTRRMLQITQPLALRDVRDGLRRRLKFRQIQLRVPLEVLREFFALHPNFEIDPEDRVSSRTELPETSDTLQRWIVEQIRANDYGLLTRVQVMQRARRERKSGNSVSGYLTYGEQIAHDRRGFYYPVGCPPDESRVSDALEVAGATIRPSTQEWYFDSNDNVVRAIIELGESVLASGVIFLDAGDRGYLDLLGSTHYPVSDESGATYGTLFKSEPLNALAGLSTLFSRLFPEQGDLLKLKIDLEYSVARADIGGSELLPG
jgi:hypothetical protein